MFAAQARILVAAGAGGDGSASFRREAHVPRGGPDGGDGGKGGDVVLEAEAGMTTLGELRRRRHLRAQPGGRGRYLGHVAPGLGNAIGSIYTSLMSGTPMIVTAGQQEVLNWTCLAGAMAELDYKADILDWVETWTFNAPKCMAVFKAA